MRGDFSVALGDGLFDLDFSLLDPLRDLDLADPDRDLDEAREPLLERDDDFERERDRDRDGLRDLDADFDLTDPS